NQCFNICAGSALKQPCQKYRLNFFQRDWWKLPLDNLVNHLRRWARNFYLDIKASPYRRIEQAFVVRNANGEPMILTVVKTLQKGVHHALDFTHLLRIGTKFGDGIEFI